MTQGANMYKKILSVGLCFIACNSLYAKEFSIVLHSIEAIKVQEQKGDELYLHLTEYPQDAKPTLARFPDFPGYWLSKNLANVKDVVIYTSSINKDKITEIIVSLIEQDLPPWAPDDHLGSIKLKLKNNNDLLEVNWESKQYNDPAFTKQSTNLDCSFMFSDGKAKYLARFKLLD